MEEKRKLMFAGVAVLAAAAAAYALAQRYRPEEQSVSVDRGERYVIVLRHGTRMVDAMPVRFDQAAFPIAECEQDALVRYVIPLLRRLREARVQGQTGDRITLDILCSPFLRTKQMALAVAQLMGIPGSRVRCLAGLGEAFASVGPQLAACGDAARYRMPVHTGLDPCMAQMEPDQAALYSAVVDHVNAAGVPVAVEDAHNIAMPPQSPDAHRLMVETTLASIVQTVPMDRDVVIVTHSSNVKRSLHVFANKRLPLPSVSTCGAIVYRQRSSTVDGNMDVLEIAN